GSTCWRASQSARSRRSSTATSSNTWAAWSTTACGWVRSPVSRTSAGSGRRWSMRSASSTRAWCAGRGAASRTPTIGMTASVRARAGRDAPTSGATIATWAVPSYGLALAFIGSGPNGGDLDWTRRFFREMAERRGFDRMWGWALHHYCSAPNGEAVAFDDTAWYDLLGSANRMESLITSHWQVMGESDRERRVKLVVDEWGAWHKMTTNLDPTHLFGQQSTIRDALVAGLTL